MKIIRKLLLSVIFIVVCAQISGCGTGVNTASNSTKSLGSTSGNTSETSKISATSSTSTHIEPSVPNLSGSSSAASTSTTSEKSQTNTSDIKSISSEDFDVYYKDIIINGKTSLDVLSQKLSFKSVEEDNETTVIRAAGLNKGTYYFWYQVSYPNKEHPEIIYDYLYNATKKSGRIVSIDLKNAHTKRGITVGDTLKKIKLAYGKFESNYDSETTEYIDFVQNNNTLTFIYEKNSMKVISINIDYNSNKAMEEMDITGLKD